MHIYEHNPLGMTGLYIVYDNGSLFEQPGFEGTMHLMEHLVCKNYDDLRDELDSHGIEHNAYTSDQHVVFHFNGLESRLSPMKNKLVDRLISGLMVDEPNFQIERTVVLEEYLDTFNDQITGNYYNTMRRYYGYHGPIGLRSSIESITLDQCKTIYQNHFIKPTKIIEIGPSKSDFSSVQYTTDRLGDIGLFNPRQYIHEPVNTNTKRSIVGISNTLCGVDKYPQFNLGLMMLGHGLQSPLSYEIREKRGLSYFSWCESNELGNSAGVIMGACTEEHRITELQNVYTDFLSDVNKHMTLDRFNICKSTLSAIYEQSNILKYHKPYSILQGNGLHKYKNIMDIDYDDVVTVTNEFVNIHSITFSIL